MRAAVLLAGVALVAAPALAQEKGSRMTRDYVAAAGNTDAFEMLEADTALTQSNDSQVRAFAQRMIRDHGQTSQTLRAAAERSGLRPPPMGLGSDQAPLLAALQSVRGPAFDKLYWHQQALGHRAALVTAQRYAANGDDPAVRQAAQAAVPVIAAHLAIAEQMAQAAGS